MMSDAKTEHVSGVSGFKRYAFADSITVTGNFTNISVSNKELVRNCNFNFYSDTVSTGSIDGMFDGCVNAVFSSRLSIPNGSSVTSAMSAFKDCKVAKLPSVDIGTSNITSCDRMFEDCHAAELCGVQIPSGASTFEGMFRNSKSAFFNEISLIPYGNGNYYELFSGCENGVFQNLEFGEDCKINLNCGNMFYYCRNMDSGNLGFSRISKCITDAGNMFYSAGSNGSKTMDNCICVFSKLSICECMFTNSNFSFDNSYFDFDGDEMSKCTVKSISKMFSGCNYCNDMSPVVILGMPQNDSFELSSINEQLNGRLNGHYNRDIKNGIENCIWDFSSLYENSNFKTLELRGIANNGVLATKNLEYKQDFSSMCKNCGNLERIVGYLPSCASTYDHMFSGCTSLSAELPSLFKTQPYNWSKMSDLEDSFDGDDAFKSYSMTSIRGMFEDCAYLYSKNDTFDIVGLFKTVERNLTQNGYDSLKYILESIKDSLPPIRLATKNPVPIPELRNVRYAIEGISENSGTIRYNSFVDDLMETEQNKKNTLAASYGLYSDYAKSAFKRGFYRYGGEFIGDRGKCFFVLFRPEMDEVTENVVGFTSDLIESHIDLRPHGWGEMFNTDSSKGYWSEFSYNNLYPAMVCTSDGAFIKFAYVGSYTRIYHEIRSSSKIGTYEYVANYSMPVTYFDGYEYNIKPL